MGQSWQADIDGIGLRIAGADDTPVILEMIHELAEYERLAHEVVADERLLRQSLFGGRRAAEVLIAADRGEPVGFAL